MTKQSGFLRKASFAAVIAFIVVLSCAVMGCSSEQGSASSSSSSSEPSQTNSNTYVLDGDIAVELLLDYSAGTGFEWVVTVDDQSVVSISDQRTEDASSTDEPIGGGPLCDHVVLWAGAPGKATVTCELVRPWEENVEPAETLTYVFEVDETGQITFLADESDYEGGNPPEPITFS